MKIIISVILVLYMAGPVMGEDFNGALKEYIKVVNTRISNLGYSLETAENDLIETGKLVTMYSNGYETEKDRANRLGKKVKIYRAGTLAGLGVVLWRVAVGIFGK